MKFAYADPPYPGQSERWYKDHPDYAGEVDHAALIGRLCRDYPDGWALSTNAKPLQAVLALCPGDVRIAVWWNTNSAHPGPRTDRWWWSWEAVIVRGGRQSRRRGDPVVRNVLACGPRFAGAYDGNAFPGQKPPEFCRWMFALLGAVAGDQLDDLFPGSGAVARAWCDYESQPWLEPPRSRALGAKEQERALRAAGAPELPLEATVPP